MLNMPMLAVFQFWKFWLGTPCARNSCLSWCWCGGSLKVFWKSFCSTTSLSTSSSKVPFRWIDCGPICCLTSFSPIWNEKCPFAAPSYHASEVVEWWLVWSTSWIWRLLPGHVCVWVRASTTCCFMRKFHLISQYSSSKLYDCYCLDWLYLWFFGKHDLIPILSKQIV